MNPNAVEVLGYAAVFNVAYRHRCADGSTFRETIAPGAFGLAGWSSAPLTALVSHDPRRVVATAAAGTLLAREDEHGLLVAAYLDPLDPQGVISGLRSGRLTGLSIGREAAGQAREVNGVRVCQSLRIEEVSFVDAGANPAALAIPTDGPPLWLPAWRGGELSWQQLQARAETYERLMDFAARLRQREGLHHRWEASYVNLRPCPAWR